MAATEKGICFVQAKESDLNTIFEMFQSAIMDMEEKGIFQWDELYPDRDILKEDIQKGQLYVGFMENEPVAAYVLNRECDGEYANGRWNYEGDSYIAIHRLCVNPKYQNHGIGTCTMKYIEECARKKGKESVRLDAFTENPIAKKLYEGLGYQIVGFANFRKGRFFLMEKGLKV